MIAGDLFHSVRPTNAAIVFAFRQFQRLREALPGSPDRSDRRQSRHPALGRDRIDSPPVRRARGGRRRRRAPPAGIPRSRSQRLAVPRQALLAPERPVLRPEGAERHQVLVVHGRWRVSTPLRPGRGGVRRRAARPTGADTRGVDLRGAGPLPHPAPGRQSAWYAGSLEYIGPNIWGELVDESDHG